MIHSKNFWMTKSFRIKSKSNHLSPPLLNLYSVSIKVLILAPIIIWNDETLKFRKIVINIWKSKSIWFLREFKAFSACGMHLYKSCISKLWKPAKCFQPVTRVLNPSPIGRLSSLLTRPQWASINRQKHPSELKTISNHCHKCCYIYF